MQISQDLLDRFGIKRTEIVFTSHKKGIIRYNNSKVETRENVSSIDIEQTPVATAISMHYITDSGEGCIGTSVENIKEIIIVD